MDEVNGLLNNIINIDSISGKKVGGQLAPLSPTPLSATSSAVPCQRGPCRRVYYRSRTRESFNINYNYNYNSALSEHTCQTNPTIAWDNFKIITTNRR